MKYIAHNRYKGKTMNGDEILIRKGKSLDRVGDILYYKNTPICIYRSLVGKQYFSNNEDGKGLERGTITYEIAYSPRVRYGGTEDRPIKRRFTDEELRILSDRWSKYIKPNCDMLLFNDDFFDESIDTLKEIAESVNIEINL